LALFPSPLVGEGGRRPDEGLEVIDHFFVDAFQALPLIRPAGIFSRKGRRKIIVGLGVNEAQQRAL